MDSLRGGTDGERMEAVAAAARSGGDPVGHTVAAALEGTGLEPTGTSRPITSGLTFAHKQK